MALPPTPWIQAPDTAGNYLKGYSLGQQAAAEQARLAAEHARLQQSAQQSQMEMEVKQKQFEQESMLQQQKLEIEKAYRQQEMALGQQKLQEAAKVSQSKIQQAAGQAAARMEYEKRVAGGEDPSKVMMEIGPRMAGSSMTGLGSVMGAASKLAPMPETKFVTDPETNTRYAIGPRGTPVQQRTQQDPAAKAAIATATHEYNALTSERFKLQQTMAEDTDKKVQANIQDQITQIVRRQRQLQQELGMVAPGTSSTAAASVPASTATATTGAAPVIAGRYVNGKLVMRPSNQSATSAAATSEVQPLVQGSPAPEAAIPDSLQSPASGGDLSQFQIQKAPASTPAPTQETQAEPSQQFPVAPQKTEDRQFGQVYLVKDGPYKGMTMKWEKDDWGHGVWGQVETPAPEWIRKSGEAVGGTLKKAYQGLTSHWGD